MNDIPGDNKWSEVNFELYFKAQKEESVCIFLRGSDTCLLFGLGLTLKGSLILAVGQKAAHLVKKLLFHPLMYDCGQFT